MNRRAVFLDKDGTLIDNIPFNADPAKIRLSLRAGPALKTLQDLGFALIVVSNQPGIARGLIAEAQMPGIYARLQELLKPYGVTLDGFRYCPHAPGAGCACRKPMPGMLQEAALEHGIALASSWMVGDILDDIEAGRRAGCRTVLLDNGNETEWQLSAMRTPDLRVKDWYAVATRIAALERNTTKKENIRTAAR